MSVCNIGLCDESPRCTDAGHRAARERRAAGAADWSAIVRGKDGGGIRDFLDGKPIHCGSGLELQGIEYRHDDFGEYVVKLETGASVRYETEWSEQGPRVILHGSIAGHEFTCRHEPWMRFRWPRR